MLYTMFVFNDTATTEIYTLSLHDALPIFLHRPEGARGTPEQLRDSPYRKKHLHQHWLSTSQRSEEHTSELQSRQYFVCRLLLEKKNLQSSDIHYQCNT